MQPQRAICETRYRMPLTPEPVAHPIGRKAQARRLRLSVLALVFSDVLLAVLVWQGASWVQETWGVGQISGVAEVSVLANVIVWIGLRALLGLYPGYGLVAAEELRRQTYVVAAALGMTTVFFLALHVGDLLSRLLLFAGFIGLALLAPVERHFVKRGLKRLGYWGKPVAVLGAGWTGAKVIRALRSEWALGYLPVAVFDDHRIEGALEGVFYGGNLDQMAGVARDYGISTAILATPEARGDRLKEITERAKASFFSVIVVPDFGEMLNSAVAARDLGGTFGVEIKQNLLNPWARRTKRALDLCGGVGCGLLLSPLLLAIAAWIRLDSPGPAIHGQERLGPGGKPFRCWKFRTMSLDAEQALDEHLRNDPDLRAEWERDQKLNEDPRVTRVGRFLRATSLDELPQLWNVLRGEMSLAGPRPIVEAEIPRYGELYSLYCSVIPGITGLWQVSGRSDTGYVERVALDAYYVRNWSVWLDLVIMSRTIESVLLRRGAR